MPFSLPSDFSSSIRPSLPPPPSTPPSVLSSKGMHAVEQIAKITLGPLCCRYKVLMRDLALPEDIRGKCTVLLQFYDASNSEWQLGKTKVQWQEQLIPPHRGGR